MCRMFAFRSRVSLGVQRSLVKAENALQVQSRAHPHGWGIAFYLTGERDPQEIKSIASAFDDDRFAKVSKFLTSHAVLAHVRKATVGELSMQNTHPFLWKGWSFCHNGTIFGFEQIRDQVLERIEPRFLPLIQGETDSEALFYLILSTLSQLGYDLDAGKGRFPEGSAQAVSDLLSWLRDLSDATLADEREAMMNFVLTDGHVLMATRWNGNLHFSTQKVRCADYEVCPVAKKVCFGPRRTGIRHTHVLIASDPTSPDDIWEEIPNRGLVTVDEELRLDVRPLPGVVGPPAWFS